jgi:hypothetical protein
MRSIKVVKAILTLGVLAQALVPAVNGAPPKDKTRAGAASKAAPSKLHPSPLTRRKGASANGDSGKGSGVNSSPAPTQKGRRNGTGTGG